MLCERLWQSGEMTKRCNILDIAVEFEKNGRQMIMKNGLHGKKERKRTNDLKSTRLSTENPNRYERAKGEE